MDGLSQISLGSIQFLRREHQFHFKVFQFQYYENCFKKLLYEDNNVVRFYDRFQFQYLPRWHKTAISGLFSSYSPETLSSLRLSTSPSASLCMYLCTSMCLPVWVSRPLPCFPERERDICFVKIKKQKYKKVVNQKVFIPIGSRSISNLKFLRSRKYKLFFLKAFAVAVFFFNFYISILVVSSTSIQYLAVYA